jgi:hypothetical protein
MKAFVCEEGAGTQPPPPHFNLEAFTMRSFQPPADTRFYGGVDLHARSLYLVVLDRDGQPRFGRNLTTPRISRLTREALKLDEPSIAWRPRRPLRRSTPGAPSTSTAPT